MIPANPDNNKPFIFRIADALGITHLVVAVQHSHLMSEIEGLVSALAGKSDTNHTHKLLLYNPSSSPDGFAGFTASGYGNFTIGVQESKSISLMFGAYTKANITNANVDNLARALQNPDTTPTADSDKLVTSGGVKAALDAKYSINQVDEDDEQEAHLSAIAEDDDIYFDFRLKNGNTQKEVLLSISKMDNFARAISNPDTTPTSNSDKLVTSGGVKVALDGKPSVYDTEVVFMEEEETPFIYLPEYFTHGEKQKTFIMDYQGASTPFADIFHAQNTDIIRILSHDDEIINIAECFLSFRVIRQANGIAQGSDAYYVIFDGKNEY